MAFNVFLSILVCEFSKFSQYETFEKLKQKAFHTIYARSVASGLGTDDKTKKKPQLFI